MDEEPMEMSPDGNRNKSYYQGFHDNSNSDMDVDTSHDMSYSSPYVNNFSFRNMSATIATSSPYKSEAKYFHQTGESVKPLGMRPLIAPKKNQEKKISNLHKDENLNTLLSESNKLIKSSLEKKKSRSKSKEMSPREKRVNRRKSENQYDGRRKFYGWLFLAVLFALLSTFIVIHQKCHIHMDVNKFEHVFDENVFGQHIAKHALTTTLRNISLRMQNDTKLSTNPLVFSFHGWTGVGKNFVTKQLLYGFDNARVTTFLIPLHFPHKSQDKEYKINIQKWVKGNITLCYVNMFVFDEMDKATPGFLEGLLSVMKDIQRIEMEKTWIIFLFLSNSRGHQINNYLFTEMKSGKKRNDITFEEILPVLTNLDSSDEWYKDFHKQGLIHTFVPFLPLNKYHVHQCIEKDIIKKGSRPTTELINSISEEMHYIQPVSDHVPYSLTGCKRVSDKVDIHI